MDLSHEELISRLHNFEDPYVERKSLNDQKDFLKTVVAFANTLPDGVPGVMFVPVMDDGRIQVADLDQIQREISKRVAPAYPEIVYFQRILNIGTERVIAVIVPGSPARPHFAGPAYIRDGSQTRNASADQFSALIARRSAKVEELAKWIGRKVTVEFISALGPRIENSFQVDLLECNQWFLTIKYEISTNSRKGRESIALNRVEISFDQTRDHLLLDIRR